MTDLRSLMPFSKKRMKRNPSGRSYYPEKKTKHNE